MDAATVLAQRLDVPDTAAECRRLASLEGMLAYIGMPECGNALLKGAFLLSRLAGTGQSGDTVFAEGTLLKVMGYSLGLAKTHVVVPEAKIFNVCGRKLMQLMDSPLPMVQRQAGVFEASEGPVRETCQAKRLINNLA